MASRSFSKARVSIWRMRSRLTSCFWLSSSSVAAGSLRRRDVRISISRSFSTDIACCIISRRTSISSLTTSAVSGSSRSSSSQSCHSPLSSSPCAIGALSERSLPDMRPSICWTSSGDTFRRSEISLTCSGVSCPPSIASIWPLTFRKLKNSFFCAAVVPIFTSDQLRRIYSCMEARIHHIA